MLKYSLNISPLGSENFVRACIQNTYSICTIFIRNFFCVSKCCILILYRLLKYKYVKIRFKSFPTIGRKVSENFCVSL